MNASKNRRLIVAAACVGAIAFFAVSSPAFAQFGGVFGGGSKSDGGGDPKQIEADLKSIIETTSEALSKLAEAMGMKEIAAKLQKNAADIKSGTVGLADSTSIVSDASASVKNEMEKNQKDGIKLDSASAGIAVQAIGPGIKSFPLWVGVVNGAKSLDKFALMSAPALVQAVQKVPTAAKNSLEMYQGGITYLTFSGADTSSLKKQAEASLKF